ncbi:MAG: NfeD family protein [Planctomycetota bacterium]
MKTAWLHRGLLAVLLVASAGASVDAQDAAAEEARPEKKRMGAALQLMLPIDGQTVDRVKQFVPRAKEKADAQGAMLVLVLEFVAPPEQTEFGRGSEFGASLSLAEYLSGPDLGGVDTVAYIPQTIQGHAVLVALACREVIMAPNASIGLAGVDERVVTETRRAHYREIADRRRKIPAPVAIWLLDPTQEVLLVETGVSREFITRDQLPELQERHVVVSQRLLFDPTDPAESIAAQRGQLSGEELRVKLKLIDFLAESREEVARALDLPPRDLKEDPSLVDGWRAVQVDVRGPMSPEVGRKLARLIDEQVRQKDANFICVSIDSPGGSLVGSLDLANTLSQFDPDDVRSVAFVGGEARADAALVALACHDVVMRSGTELGGPGAREFNETEIEQAVSAIRNPNGPWRHRSWSLVAAMIDPNLTVYRCVRPGEEGYFSDMELDERRLDDPREQPWERKEQVSVPGQPLLVAADRAMELGLAYAVVESFAELKSLYRLKSDPALLQSGWAEDLVQALASPGLAVLLLMIGFVALYIELHTPGVGVGAFVAAICFVLFFWSRFLGGTAGWLEATLFALGFVFLLLEIFVLPGFGVFGLGGGLLVLTSLVLASQTFVWPENTYQFHQLQQSLLTVTLAGLGCLVVALVVRRWLPRVRIFGEVVLEPPQGEEAATISRRESLVDLANLVGQTGTTTTPLLPGGKARIGDRLVDVISDGELIAKGTPIVVVKVQGNHVQVRANPT